MKRAFLVALMVCLLIAPARAEEMADQPLEDNTQYPNVVVTTLDELQEAIASADNGDTIEITQTIKIAGEDIATEKDITIACAEVFEDGTMFRTREGSIVGLSFKGGRAKEIFAIVNDQEEKTIFQNCKFDGENVAEAVNIYGALDISGSGKTNFVKIIDSEFTNCFGSAVSARASTDVVIDRCHIHDTYAINASGAVSSSGKVALNDCIITRNSSVANAGVLCSGTLIVSGGQIRDNTIRSTDIGVAVDIFCSGTWSIIDEGTEGAGYYDAATGEKLSLPIHENDTLARLVYLQDEDAEDYFLFLSEPDVPEIPPASDGDKDDIENSSKPPQKSIQPSEGEGEDDTNEQPETPIEPPKDSDADGSDDAPPQLPEQPEEPPQGDDTTDNNSGGASDTPQEPQIPSDGDSDNNDMPPTDYRPSWRPMWPTISFEPTDTSKPEQSDDTPAPAQAPLVCNGATIDVSRSVVLLGYGDGLIHEDDFLTRAQMATVIFRLLDDDSIALYRDAQLAFVDVPANAWYTDYVRVIQAAGIVNGVGGGRYDPEGLLTWGQTLTILSRFVELKEYELQYIQYDGWASRAIQTAVAYGWIEDSATFIPDAVISRGQLEALINSILAQYR